MAGGPLLSKCPACGAKNRVPPAKVAARGKCGRCGGALEPKSFYAEAPVALSEGHFDLVTRFSPQPVLVDFWAPWCAPCLQMAPLLEQLAGDLVGRLLVVKVDTEQAPVAASRFAVQGIPTLVLLRSGIEVDRIVGLLPLPALRRRVDRFLT